MYACKPKYDKSVELAVKVLSLKADSISDLNNEVRLLQSVRSPNVVQLVRIIVPFFPPSLFFHGHNFQVETFMDKEHFYLVMECVKGGELVEVLSGIGTYTELESQSAFRQLVEALRVLQHHQIVHRDIKPENLLMTKPSISSQLKLADFGLAIQIKPGDRLKGFFFFFFLLFFLTFKQRWCRHAKLYCARSLVVLGR